jgi:hypothetical protein
MQSDTLLYTFKGLSIFNFNRRYNLRARALYNENFHSICTVDVFKYSIDYNEKSKQHFSFKRLINKEGNYYFTLQYDLDLFDRVPCQKILIHEYF